MILNNGKTKLIEVIENRKQINTYVIFRILKR